MKYSELKALKAFCESLTSEPDWREVIDHAGEDDFEVDGVRFIADYVIDQVQQDELKSDLYCLGCFNANLLAEVLDIPQTAIEAIQKAEAFEALGEMVVSIGKITELQEAYASADGYGNHFNSYDFSEEEITIDGTDYHVFDNRG